MAKNFGKSNTFMLSVAAVGALGIAGLVGMVFLNVFKSETYYVLKEDVPARAMIDPEMLKPISTNEGSAPPNALNLKDVSGDRPVFTKYPILAGDILSESNAGFRQDVASGVPDNWVVTNFSVGADNAVGGRIQTGSYFDMLVVTNEGGYYPFVNILALDTTVSMAGASNANAADTEEAKAGMTSQYVVGMTPENAAKLHQIVGKGGDNIKLLVSPRQNVYAPVDLASYSGVFSYHQGDEPVNLGIGTGIPDNQIKRDKTGRPIGSGLNDVVCGVGNEKLFGADCNDFAKNEVYKNLKSIPGMDKVLIKGSKSDSNSSDSSSSESSDSNQDSSSTSTDGNKDTNGGSTETTEKPKDSNN